MQPSPHLYVEASHVKPHMVPSQVGVELGGVGQRWHRSPQDSMLLLSLQVVSSHL
jgi:hypothetical protein